MPNSFWKARLGRADSHYKEWSTRFKCATLEKYYEGQQWGRGTGIGTEPYVVNLVYSTLKIQAANILLSYPQFLITPRPGNADYNQEAAIQSAQVKEDTLNTVISDDLESFTNTCHLAFLDSKFRFGVVEVGYAADWLRNPLAAAPLLKHQETKLGKDDKDLSLGTEDVKIVQEPVELPDSEKIYIKRIPANRFRVSTQSAQELHHCDWIGYYEFISLADLKAISGLKSEWLKDAHVYYTEEDRPVHRTYGAGDEKAAGGTVKVWHIWDIRAKKRFLILDSPCEAIWEDDFKRLPIVDLRWDLLLNGWYPMPPVFQWLSPQNEYNEAREMMRSYRRRFLRKFQQVGDSVEQEELDKFTSNVDGSIIKVGVADALRPILNPPLDANVKEALIVSKDDFNEMSGTSSADRGRVDRTTATEANRVGMKADIRDSAEDAVYNRFMTRIGREVLLLMRDRFTTGTWAKLGADPGEAFLGEIQENPAYQWVSSEKLDDGYDFKVSVNVISASPIKNDDEEKKFLKFLSFVQNFPQIALSPLLVREAAYRAGYRNERVIKEMQKMATLTMLGSIQHAQGAAQASNVPQNVVAQQTPNTQEQINQNLDGQLVQ